MSNEHPPLLLVVIDVLDRLHVVPASTLLRIEDVDLTKVAPDNMSRLMATLGVFTYPARCRVHTTNAVITTLEPAISVARRVWALSQQGMLTEQTVATVRKLCVPMEGKS